MLTGILNLDKTNEVSLKKISIFQPLIFQIDSDQDGVNLSYEANTKQELLRIESIRSEVYEEKCRSLNITAIEASHVVTGISYGGKSKIGTNEVCYVIMTKYF